MKHDFEGLIVRATRDQNFCALALLVERFIFQLLKMSQE